MISYKITSAEKPREILTRKKAPGVYEWWITKQGAIELEIPLELLTKEEDGYYLIYIGLATDVDARLNHHWRDIHRRDIITKAKTYSGFISSLNSTLAALLKVNPIPANNPKIKGFMYTHMKSVVNIYTKSKAEAGLVESLLIAKYQPALNTSESTNAYAKILKAKRKQYSSKKVLMEVING